VAMLKELESWTAYPRTRRSYRVDRSIFEDVWDMGTTLAVPEAITPSQPGTADYEAVAVGTVCRAHCDAAHDAHNSTSYNITRMS
jgi:hypothetical protein